MLSWLVKRVLTHNLTRLNAGDYRPALRLDAKHVRFRSPADSSWAIDLEGKDALERWLQRFVDTGLQIFADEVVAQGPQSNMTLRLRGHVHLKTPDGALVYENRYVIWGRLAWRLLREYEVYEDTQASKALDAYLGVTGATPSPVA